jgi:hypothetical protein
MCSTALGAGRGSHDAWPLTERYWDLLALKILARLSGSGRADEVIAIRQADISRGHRALPMFGSPGRFSSTGQPSGSDLIG